MLNDEAEFTKLYYMYMFTNSCTCSSQVVFVSVHQVRMLNDEAEFTKLYYMYRFIILPFSLFS